jgi:hypothetical protein
MTVSGGDVRWVAMGDRPGAGARGELRKAYTVYTRRRRVVYTVYAFEGSLEVVTGFTWR